MSQIALLFWQYKKALSPYEEGLFTHFLSLFLEYNGHTNLSAIRDEEGIIVKHFIDSVLVDDFEKIEGRLLDIGTGGGFPGIPLKILHPDLQVTLLDSVSKKTKACDHFISALGLEGIGTVWWRAETIKNDPKHAHQYDIIVSRATAYITDILTWAKPFLRPNGKIILYKTPSDDEAKDLTKILKSLGLKILKTHTYQIAGQTRNYFVITNK